MFSKCEELDMRRHRKLKEVSDVDDAGRMLIKWCLEENLGCSSALESKNAYEDFRSTASQESLRRIGHYFHLWQDVVEVINTMKLRISDERLRLYCLRTTIKNLNSYYNMMRSYFYGVPISCGRMELDGFSRSPEDLRFNLKNLSLFHNIFKMQAQSLEVEGFILNRRDNHIDSLSEMYLMSMNEIRYLLGAYECIRLIANKFQIPIYKAISENIIPLERDVLLLNQALDVFHLMSESFMLDDELDVLYVHIRKCFGKIAKLVVPMDILQLKNSTPVKRVLRNIKSSDIGDIKLSELLSSNNWTK